MSSQALATRYPLVLVPGMLGFVRLVLYPYWFGIVSALRRSDLCGANAVPVQGEGDCRALSAALQLGPNKGMDDITVHIRLPHVCFDALYLRQTHAPRRAQIRRHRRGNHSGAVPDLRAAGLDRRGADGLGLLLLPRSGPHARPATDRRWRSPQR